MLALKLWRAHLGALSGAGRLEAAFLGVFAESLAVHAMKPTQSKTSMIMSGPKR